MSDVDHLTVEASEIRAGDQFEGWADEETTTPFGGIAVTNATVDDRGIIGVFWRAISEDSGGMVSNARYPPDMPAICIKRARPVIEEDPLP